MFERLKRWFTFSSPAPSWEQSLINAIAAQQRGLGDPLGLTAIKAAVDAISSELASVSIFTYERSQAGRKVASWHPSYRLIHERPNDNYTIDVYLRLIGVDLCLKGNHYAFVQREGTVPVGLVRLDPDSVKPKIVDGWLVYEVTVQKGKGTGKETLSPYDLIHIKGISTDGIVGLSPIDCARQSISLANNVETLGERYFAKGFIGNQIIKHPGKLTDVRRNQLVKDITDNHAGSGNSFSTLLLEEGMEIDAMTLNLEQLQWLQSRTYNKNEIASGIFKVPPPFYGDYTNLSQYGSMGNVSTIFYKNCIRPILISIENEFSSKLLREDERESLYIECSIESLLRGSPLEQVEIWSKEIAMGTLLKDEVREMQNRPSIYGPLQSQIDLQKQKETEDTEKRFAQLEEKLFNLARPTIDKSALLADCSKRVLTKELNALKRAQKKFFSSSEDVEGFTTWANDFYESQLDTVEGTFSPVLKATSDESEAIKELMEQQEKLAGNRWDIALKAMECDEKVAALEHMISELEKLIHGDKEDNAKE